MRISDWSSDVCSSDLLQMIVIGEVLDLHRLITCQKPVERSPHERVIARLCADREPQLTVPLFKRLKRNRLKLDAPPYLRNAGKIGGCIKSNQLTPQLKLRLVRILIHDDRATGCADTKIGSAHVGTPVTNAHLV